MVLPEYECGAWLTADLSLTIGFSVDNRFVIIGHRGSGEGNHPVGGPENTLPSIRYAVSAGADEIETDLAITRDDRLILYHDALLPVSRRAPEHVDWESVHQECPDVITVDSLFHAELPVPFVLELKSYTAFQKIIDVFYSTYTQQISKMRWISFHQPALEYIRQKDQNAYCIFIATCRDERFDPVVRRRHIDWCRDHAIQEISGHWFTFSRRMIERAQSDLTVSLGMIDSMPRLKKCRQHGVQRLYTNRVAELRQWIKSEAEK